MVVHPSLLAAFPALDPCFRVQLLARPVNVIFLLLLLLLSLATEVFLLPALLLPRATTSSGAALTHRPHFHSSTVALARHPCNSCNQHSQPWQLQARAQFVVGSVPALAVALAWRQCTSSRVLPAPCLPIKVAAVKSA